MLRFNTCSQHYNPYITVNSRARITCYRYAVLVWRRWGEGEGRQIHQMFPLLHPLEDVQQLDVEHQRGTAGDDATCMTRARGKVRATVRPDCSPACLPSACHCPAGAFCPSSLRDNWARGAGVCKWVGWGYQ